MPSRSDIQFNSSEGFFAPLAHKRYAADALCKSYNWETAPCCPGRTLRIALLRQLLIELIAAINESMSRDNTAIAGLRPTFLALARLPLLLGGLPSPLERIYMRRVLQRPNTKFH